jgi:hypothetical protein
MGKPKSIRLVTKKLYEIRMFPVVFLIFFFPHRGILRVTQGLSDPCYSARPKTLSAHQLFAYILCKLII